LQKRARVTACFFGEGAVAEGEFHETLNLAALWKLPVLFLCENNLYAMGTALSRSESDTDLCTKAASYNMPAASVDGMDVEAVWSAAHEAVGTVRRLGIPYFLELKTYRFRAHSMFDPELYRDKAEIEQWKKHCPIATHTARLEASGWIKPVDIEAMRSRIEAELDQAVAFAEAGSLESIEDLERDVYARPVTPRAEKSA